MSELTGEIEVRSPSASNNTLSSSKESLLFLTKLRIYKHDQLWTFSSFDC